MSFIQKTLFPVNARLYPAISMNASRSSSALPGARKYSLIMGESAIFRAMAISFAVELSSLDALNSMRRDSLRITSVLTMLSMFMKNAIPPPASITKKREMVKTRNFCLIDVFDFAPFLLSILSFFWLNNDEKTSNIKLPPYGYRYYKGWEAGFLLHFLLIRALQACTFYLFVLFKELAATFSTYLKNFYIFMKKDCFAYIT